MTGGGTGMARGPLFVFGTLLDPELRGTVLGHHVAAVPAVLIGHRVERSRAGDWPILAARAGARTEGLLLDADATALDRAHFYEAGFGYLPETAEVEAGGPVRALIYRAPEGAGSGESWSLDRWQVSHGALTRATAARAMAMYGSATPEELRFRMPTLRARVFSELQAARTPVPRTLRADIHRDRVRVLSHDTPYCHYFALSETRLRHPLFGGGLSPEILRAGFHGGDAVTVLPYDPARDRVMLIEQFRYGPWLRGDLYPWALEPIAGRVDPGETPDRTARREAREEAGLEIGALHEVGCYYASPGAVTEYVTSYIGIADLPDAAEGIGGLDAEAEDIRAHVITFRRLMDLLDSGEVDTGPLMVSVLWLERERNRGRFA